MNESRCANVRRGFGLAVTVAGWLACAAPADADLIQFTFAGEITEIEGDAPDVWESVEIGDPWEVSYVFDSEAKDELEEPFLGRWDYESFTVTMAGASTTSVTGDISLDFLTHPYDFYQTFAYDLSIGGQAKVELRGIEVFPNDDLPLDLYLNNFFSTFFEIAGIGGGGEGFLMDGDILMFERRTVPVHFSWMIFLLSAMAQHPISRRRR